MTTEQITRLIEFVQGSCMTLSEGTQSLFNLDDVCLTEENLEQIDGEIFHCSECNWWYEVSEISDRDDEQVCSDCNN